MISSFTKAQGLFLALATLGLAACDSSQPTQTAETATMAPETATDPYLWLEEVEGDRALDWVRSQNDRSLGELRSDPRYDEIYTFAEGVLTSSDRIAYAGFFGDRLSNFWRDGTSVRGLWRTTTLDSYRTDNPEWKVVLDLDALAEAEGENWVYAGSNCLPPDVKRCLLTLSRGGSDAAVIREFDTTTGEFVADGFVLAEAKQSVQWIDEDTLLIASPNEGGSRTDSGYSRTLRLWKRGTPLADAAEVMAVNQTDLGVFPLVVHRPEGTTRFGVIAPTIFTETLVHLDEDGVATQLPLPEDINTQGMFHGKLLALLRSPWTVGETTYAANALVAIPLEGLMAGNPEPELIMNAPNRGTISGVGAGRDVIWVSTLQNVTGGLQIIRPTDDGWRSEAIDLPENGTLSVYSVDVQTNRALVNFESFLVPDSLFMVDADSGAVEQLKSLPERFDASSYKTEQRFATSADGTEVPYFIVYDETMVADGSNPTMVFGYGGFQVSYTPSYMGPLPISWLKRGGVYVVANIRGGGEFGPTWHQAALKENRQRAFDDFIAVGEDLVADKVTSPDHLGIYGGSNGGLLVGAVAVQRPDLYNAVICAVPLLDMLRYHKLLAGASWMGEYGNPDIPEERAYIEAYSPYQNLEEGKDYPRIFFYTSTKDDRVHPGHARKMAAKMEGYGMPFLYYENIEGGHSAAANLAQRAMTDALSTVYLLQQLKD